MARRKIVRDPSKVTLSRRVEKQVGRVEKAAEEDMKRGVPKQEAMENAYARLRDHPRGDWRVKAKKKAAKKKR